MGGTGVECWKRPPIVRCDCPTQINRTAVRCDGQTDRRANAATATIASCCWQVTSYDPHTARLSQCDAVRVENREQRCGSGSQTRQPR